MTSRTRTPGPWKWEWVERDLGWMNAGTTPVLRGPDGKALIDAFSPYEEAGLRSEYPNDVAEANAAFIVRACNSFDALLAAAKAARFNIIETAIGEHELWQCRVCGVEGHNEDPISPYRIKHSKDCIAHVLDAAIAAAEGGE